MVRNSNQDALTEDEFEELVDAAQNLQPPYDAECLFVLVAGGRLGMRAGEIAHISEDWVNWNKKQIDIPRFDRCEKGQNGEICGYCKQQAQQSADCLDISYDEAVEKRWEPKTPNSARAVPFDFSPFVEAVVDSFFDRYDHYGHSRVSINRRVNRVLEEAGYPTDYTYPHALRATAGTWHAYQGLSAPALQSLMGWANLDVAQKYIRLSGGQTAQALRETHQEG